MWSFLTLDKERLADFSFDIFNQSGKRGLNYEDMFTMMEVIHGKHSKTNDLKEKLRAVASIMSPPKEGGHYVRSDLDLIVVPRADYLRKINDFPALVWPVFELQVII